MPSPEKFRETLTDFAVSEPIIQDMYLGFGTLASKTPKKTKAAFFTQAITVMNEKLPKEQVQALLEANACCKSGARDKTSKEFARIQKDTPLEDRLRLIAARPYLNMGKPELDEKGDLVIYAVHFYVEDHYACACPTVSKVKKEKPIPKEYCYCCGGHFKYHYEIMLGKKLELAEIVSSPHEDQTRPCTFRFRFIQ